MTQTQTLPNKMKQEKTSQCEKCNAIIEQKYLREDLCFNCWRRKQIQINKIERRAEQNGIQTD